MEKNQTVKIYDVEYETTYTAHKRTDKNFTLLKQNRKHPSLNFKKVGKTRWSVRIKRNYRALAREENGIFVWFWIGRHDEYLRRIQ